MGDAPRTSRSRCSTAVQAHPAQIAALQQVKDSATGIDKLALDASFVRVNDAYTWPLFPEFSQVQPILWGEIEKVLSNQKKPKEALDFAARRGDEDLQGCEADLRVTPGAGRTEPAHQGRPTRRRRQAHAELQGGTCR